MREQDGENNYQRNLQPFNSSHVLSDTLTKSKYESFVSGLCIPPSTACKIADIVQLVCNPVHTHGNTKTKAINLLLDDCCCECPVDVVVSYVTCSGYDLLQMFVAHGLYSAVEHTLQLGYDVDLLIRPCSSPLHLACKNGHADITELFLRHGADMNFSSTTCFPSEHSTLQRTSTDQSVYYSTKLPWSCCAAEKQTLINLSLCSDNVDMIQVLMQQDFLEHLDTKMVLYEACQLGALRCLEFMIPLLPKQANQRYGFQQDLSLFSIAFAQSASCGCVLLESNISWKQDIILQVNSSGESLLHLVLQYPDMPLFYLMVQVTLEKYLMKTHINNIDYKGNSPLFVLLKMIGKQVTLEHRNYERNISKQMFDILRYLIQQGADVHIRNNAGKTVLHVLLPDDIEYHPTVCVQSLPEISRVIEYLLQFNIDVNGHSREVVHPLVWAVKVLSSFSIYTLDTAWSPFANLVRLLLAHGANPNIEVKQGIHIINIMMSTVNHWLKQSATDGSLDCASCMLRRMASMIHELFLHGVCFSCDVLELYVKQIMMLCNVSIATEDPVTSSVLIQHIGTLLRILFIHGLDPHDLEMVAKQQSDMAICQLNSLFYLARAFIVHRHTGSMFQILSILECSLDQRHLNNLLSSLRLVLNTNFSLDQDLSCCIHFLRERQLNPRPLQSLCKVVISRQLVWRLSERVPFLKLPKALHSYLLYYIPCDVSSI